MSWMPLVPAENGICPALGIPMRSIIIGLLLIAPPTFAQQSSTAGPGKPQTFSIVALIERELIPAAEPRRETLLACSGNTRTTLVQLNQDQPERLYDTAEVNYYVVAGEGTVRMAGRDTGLAAGSLVALPRGTTHGMVHRGKRPLILLVTLSGSPCEQTR
jgi:quercetin dioxygenase-like cupin family protein